MPTPRERTALIFVAGLGALGVGARAFRGSAQTASPATSESRQALDRQIGAVDSASTAKRRPGGSRSKVRRKADVAETETESAKRRPGRAGAGSAKAGAGDLSGAPLPGRGSRGMPDTARIDPMSKYEARRQAVARVNRGVQARIDRDRRATIPPPESRSPKVPPSHKKARMKRPAPTTPSRP